MDGSPGLRTHTLVDLLARAANSGSASTSVAAACRERDVRTVAVTAGYVCEAPRAEFYGWIDAANVDLKGFTDSFYRKLASGGLAPVLETLRYIRHETDTWLEITTLLIPGENDSDAEIHALTRWVLDELGPDRPRIEHKTWAAVDAASVGFDPVARVAIVYGAGNVVTGEADRSSGGNPVLASTTV